MRAPLIALEFRRAGRASVLPVAGAQGCFRIAVSGLALGLLFLLPFYLVRVPIGGLLGLQELLGATFYWGSLAWMALAAYANPLLRGPSVMDDDHLSNPWPHLIMADITPREYFWSKVTRVFAPSIRQILVALPIFMIGVDLSEYPVDGITNFTLTCLTYSFMLSCLVVLAALCVDGRAQVQSIAVTLAVAFSVGSWYIAKRIPVPIVFDPAWEFLPGYAFPFGVEQIPVMIVHVGIGVSCAWSGVWMANRIFSRNEYRAVKPLGKVIHVKWARHWAGPTGRLYLAGTGLRQSVKAVRYLPYVALVLAFTPTPLTLWVTILLMSYVIVGSIHNTRETDSFTLLSLACADDRDLSRAIVRGHEAQFLPVLIPMFVMRMRDYTLFLGYDEPWMYLTLIPLTVVAALEVCLLFRCMVAVSCWSVIDKASAATHSLTVLLLFAGVLWSWLETTYWVPAIIYTQPADAPQIGFLWILVFVGLRTVVYGFLTMLALWMFRRYLRRPLPGSIQSRTMANKGRRPRWASDI